MVWYSVFCMRQYKQSCGRKSVFFHRQDCFYWCMQNTMYHTISVYTECATRYWTLHFFNNFTTNKDIATKFEADLPRCVRNVKEKNVLLFKFRCNIFIGVRIIKEMPGSVASGTFCMYVCVCMCVCMYVCVYVCIYVIYVYTHTHTYKAAEVFFPDMVCLHMVTPN
jgi:hypothetical protein